MKKKRLCCKEGKADKHIKKDLRASSFKHRKHTRKEKKVDNNKNMKKDLKATGYKN